MLPPPSSAMFLLAGKGLRLPRPPPWNSLAQPPTSLRLMRIGSSYLLHLLFAHAKFIVAKEEGPDVLADLMFHTSIVHLP